MLIFQKKKKKFRNCVSIPFTLNLGKTPQKLFNKYIFDLSLTCKVFAALDECGKLNHF